MKTTTKKLYEAMFLVDSAEAAADWEGINATIKGILEKAEAEIVSMKKWAERALAYEIRTKDRGTYILCYFRAGGEKISEIEKAVQLSERIMRVLILSTEGRGGEDIEKGPPAMRAKRYGRKAAHGVAAESEALEQSAEPVVLEAVQPEQSDGAGSNSEQVNEQDESRPSEGREEKESEEN